MLDERRMTEHSLASLARPVPLGASPNDPAPRPLAAGSASTGHLASAPWLEVPDAMPLAGVLRVPCAVRILASGGGPGPATLTGSDLSSRRDLVAQLLALGHEVAASPQAAPGRPGWWSLLVSHPARSQPAPPATGWIDAAGPVDLAPGARPAFGISARGTLHAGAGCSIRSGLRASGRIDLDEDCVVHGPIHCDGGLRLGVRARALGEVSCNGITLGRGAAVLAHVRSLRADRMRRAPSSSALEDAFNRSTAFEAGPPAVEAPAATEPHARKAHARPPRPQHRAPHEDAAPQAAPPMAPSPEGTP